MKKTELAIFYLLTDAPIIYFTKRNANKYQLALKVFPHASKQYEDAMDVTYCFTDNPNDEVPEDVAIERFIQNEQKRKK